MNKKDDLSIPSGILSKSDIYISQYNGRDIKLTDLTDDDLQKYASSMRIPLEQQETFNKMEEIYVMRGLLPKTRNYFLIY